MSELSLSTPQIDSTAFIAPTAVLHGEIKVERLAVVMFGTG